MLDLKGNPFDRKFKKNHWQLLCYAPPSDKADPGPAYIGKRVTWKLPKRIVSTKEVLSGQTRR